MRPLRIVHIIERFASTGPERSILAAAKYAALLGLQQEHVVCTLEKTGSPVTVLMARRAGVQVILGPDPTLRQDLLTKADMVMVHFWNSPALWEFLRIPLPATRLVIWLKIFGGHPPQVIPRGLHDFADVIVATSPGTLHLPEFTDRIEPTPVIYGIADFARLDGFSPQAHAGFQVGYIGSLASAKIHPNFVAMSAAVDLPNVRFIVCGTGGEKRLQQQAQLLGAADRFEFRGYTEAIRSVLEICDIFGYPLCPETYATSEKAIQEAMWVGVPPVVFPYGGVPYLVEDGVTGRVVESEREYSAAIEWLSRHPHERRRLGQNAQEVARDVFVPTQAVVQMADLFATLMAQPKRERLWPGGAATPAEWFVEALGDHAGPFNVSLTGEAGLIRDAAEAEIAAMSDVLWEGEGGVIHYRNRWPNDPHLRLWSSLALARRGDGGRARREAGAAAALGVERPVNSILKVANR